MCGAMILNGTYVQFRFYIDVQNDLRVANLIFSLLSGLVVSDDYLTLLFTPKAS